MNRTELIVRHTDLVDFLIRAKRATYAGKGAETASCRPGSHDLAFSEGELTYYDSYFGGNEFVGEEAVWIDGRPFWSMNYAGRVFGSGFSGDFLKEALLRVPAEKPFRGPEFHTDGKYTYTCDVNGDFGWFQGYEAIYLDGRKIYECFFHGSTVR